jgi:hypothetical protein
MTKIKVLQPTVTGEGEPVERTLTAKEVAERKAFLEGKLSDLQERMTIVKAELKQLSK